jgi:hypothetical protein
VRTRRLSISLLLILSFGAGFAQDCPKWGDKAGALKFLQDNKAHGTDADPACVSTAFATLSHDKSAAEPLVELLDFERSTKNDDFKTHGKRYPAIGALIIIGQPAVPYLLKAITESSGELVRVNAAHTLGAIYAPCIRSLIASLEKQAAKPGTTANQQASLRAAEDYLIRIYPPCKSKVTQSRP